MKLSVIVPVYNMAPWLRECLESVRLSAERLVQEAPGDRWVEIVCVDDGSTDGSGVVIDEFAEGGSQAGGVSWRVIRQGNLGVSAARNAGLDAATGDFIAFVDGDDTVDESWLTELWQTVSRPGVEMVRGRWTGEEPSEVGDDVAGVCRHGYACISCYRRETIGKTRFVDGLGFAEDLVFNLELLAKGARFAKCDCVGYRYRQRPDSARTREVPGDEWLKLVDGCERALEKAGALRRPEWIAPVSRMLLDHVGRWAACGRRREGERELRGRLQAMRRAGRLVIRATKFKYWLPLWCYLELGWRAPVKALQLVIGVERWRREHMSM